MSVATLASTVLVVMATAWAPGLASADHTQTARGHILVGLGSVVGSNALDGPQSVLNGIDRYWVQLARTTAGDEQVTLTSSATSGGATDVDAYFYDGSRTLIADSDCAQTNPFGDNTQEACTAPPDAAAILVAVFVGYDVNFTLTIR
ncbi:MAG: hypothetical protein ACYDCK_09135 [Thermoplasmatota archaeon]